MQKIFSKPTAPITDSLENLIAEATSPLSTHIDLHTFQKIYESIKNTSTGPETTTRLLAHKIQSPQEKESLAALTILDLCVQNCGARMQSEIGKYKFLNAMINILSPKYSGDISSPAVKEKCIHLLFTWQRDFGATYPKIPEVYHLLRKQGVITDDPELLSESPSSNAQAAALASRADIFKNSRHSSTLERLLKSRNPDDLRQANAIIRSIVNEEDVRVEKQSRRALELETLKNNSTLLDEMLKHFKPNDQSASDTEVMEVIANNIKTCRPLIFELALTDDDREEGFLADVINTCSRASSILERYEVLVLHHTPSTVSDPAASAVSPPSQPDPLLSDEPQAASTDRSLLSQDLLLLGLDDGDFTPLSDAGKAQPSPIHLPNYDPISNSDDFLNDVLCSSPPTGNPIAPLQALTPSMVSTTASSSIQPMALVEPITNGRDGAAATNYAFLNSPFKATGVNVEASRKEEPAPSAKIFSDLDLVGRELLGFSKNPEPSNKSSTCSLNSLRQQPVESEQSKEFTPGTPLESNHSTTPSATVVSLATLPDLPLSSIQPHLRYTKPITVFEDDQQHHVTVTLHYTANEPCANVRVFVADVSSKNPRPISQLALRFGVDKPQKLRQLTASTTSLPAFCSFPPPSPIQQILYIQNPNSSQVATLKYQLSFSVDDEDVLESGKVTIFLD